jgi:cyclophilin family peptidyl-prolyl cis-trans isomerase
MRRHVFLYLLAHSAAVFAQNTPPATDVEAVVSTDLGTFRFEFAPDKAPKHVENFLQLARAGYYDGSAFHRVYPDGMIQGGDPLLKNPKTPKNLWGTGALNLLKSEITDLKHEQGAVSTVRFPSKPDSDGNQFFVCVAAQPSLDGQYSVFARITEGLDIVQKISQSPASGDGIVDQPVRILKVTIEPKKQQPFLHATKDELRRTVTLKTTLGTVRVKMEPDWAPENVRAFLMLTASGWYKGTGFHRIAKGFVVQGGAAGTRAGNQYNSADRWVHPIQAEFASGTKHVRGVVSMAHGEDPNTATTSFFMMLAPAENLDGQYSAFGRIVEGLDVLEAFEKEEVDGETPKRRLEILDASVDGLE